MITKHADNHGQIHILSFFTSNAGQLAEKICSNCNKLQQIAGVSQQRNQHSRHYTRDHGRRGRSRKRLHLFETCWEERSPVAVSGVEGGDRRGGGIRKLFGGKMEGFFQENVGISPVSGNGHVGKWKWVIAISKPTRVSGNVHVGKWLSLARLAW